MWSCHPLVGGHLCQEHVCSSQNKQVKTNFLWRVWWLVKRDTSKAVGDFRSHLVLRALGGTWLFKNANAGDEKKRVKRKMAIVIGFIGTRPVWAIFVEACLLVLFLWAYQLVLFLIQTLTSIFFNVCWPAMSVFPNTHIICSPQKMAFASHVFLLSCAWKPLHKLNKLKVTDITLVGCLWHPFPSKQSPPELNGITTFFVGCPLVNTFKQFPRKYQKNCRSLRKVSRFDDQSGSRGQRGQTIRGGAERGPLMSLGRNKGFAPTNAM